VYVAKTEIPQIISGKSDIEEALALIRTLLNFNLSNQQRNKVNNAVSSLEAALNERNFLDINNLSEYGIRLYLGVSAAIFYINNLSSNPDINSVVVNSINLLYSGSRILTAEAIELAEQNCAAPCNCDLLLQVANSQLNNADQRFANSNYLLALTHLTLSWTSAQTALGTQLRKEGTVNNLPTDIPTEYMVEQNYPNPFNPSTEIRYQIPENGHVKLEIFDILGNLVTTLVDQELNAGYHSYNWNASGLSSGVYLYRITSGKFVATKKLMLMK
jgi:hypothetical protein